MKNKEKEYLPSYGSSQKSSLLKLSNLQILFYSLLLLMV